MMMIIRQILLTCLFSTFFFSKSLACEYNVRDIGFIDIESSPYLLYCYVRDDTPPDFISTFKQTSLAAFEESNVTSEIIHVARQKNHPAIEYFRFWDLQSLPAMILASPDGRSLVLPINASLKSLNENLGDAVENIVSSPVRAEMLERIIKAYGIILFFEGKDVNENNSMYAELNDATQKIAEIMKQLPKRIEEPPYIIRIQQESFVKEKILLWSLNLNEQEMDKPQIALIYGRGRQFGPLLSGEQNTQRDMVNLLGMIGLSCECGLDRKWMTGTLLPLRWEDKIQSDVVKYLGFDAENPSVRMEVSQILTSNVSKTFDNKNEREEMFKSYGEKIVKREVNNSSQRISPSQFQALNSPGAAANQESENRTSIQHSDDNNKTNAKMISLLKNDSNNSKLMPDQNRSSEIQKSLATGIGDHLKVSLLISGLIVLIVLAGGLYILWQRPID
jgi:hypothetical protein